MSSEVDRNSLDILQYYRKSFRSISIFHIYSQFEFSHPIKDYVARLCSSLVPSTKFSPLRCCGTSFVVPGNSLYFLLGRLAWIWHAVHLLRMAKSNRPMYMSSWYRTKLSYLQHDLSQGHLKICNYVNATTEQIVSGLLCTPCRGRKLHWDCIGFYHLSCMLRLPYISSLEINWLFHDLIQIIWSFREYAESRESLQNKEQAFWQSLWSHSVNRSFWEKICASKPCIRYPPFSQLPFLLKKFSAYATAP